MEQISSNLKLPQQGTSGETSTTSAAYRKTVGQLILKARLACSLPSLDTHEFPAAVEAWCEILVGSLPLNRLNDCYRHAMKHRSSTYPLAVTELIASWRTISAGECARRRTCTLCGGEGSALVYDKETDSDIVKECPHCFGKITTAITAFDSTM